MSRARKRLVAAGGALAGVVLLVVLAVVVLTRTDWGRERVRAFSVSQLASQVAGQVAIGGLSGNLLRGATLTDVAIADSAGAPFLLADTLAVRYSLRSFLSKHLVFTDVRIVNPIIVLDQPPGGEWNFVRLFPQDTASQLDTVSGFGSWIRIEDVTIRNGTVAVRMAWQPADSLTGAARQHAIEAAVSPASRPWIVPVSGGHQMVAVLLDVHAQLPLLRLAHPDSAARVFELASLRATALPFRPPAASIRDLAGRFLITEDSLFFEPVRLVLPGTDIEARGAYALESGALSALVRAAPLALEDLHWLLPDLPDGGGSLALRVDRGNGTLSVEADRIAVAVGGATLAGHAHVHMGDTLRLGDTELAFTNLDTRLIEHLAPGTAIPVSGTAAGRIALVGQPSALRVDGWAEFRQRDGSTSRVVADGGIATAGGFRAHALRLRLDPLQIRLLRGFAPDLPMAGTIGGTVTINGSTASRIAAALDVVVADVTGRSHLTGDAAVVPRGGPHVDIDLRARELALETVGAFAPGAGLRGTASGRLGARGTARALTFAAHLALPDGGGVTADGSLSRSGGVIGYDVRLLVDSLDASVASTRAPETALTGTLSVIGAGTDPASMNATLAARLVNAQLGSATVDTTSIDATVADGRALVEHAVFRLASATTSLEGSFGLVDARAGELRYRIAVDSLSDFDAWIPGDTSDTVTGSIRGAGSIAGHIGRFDARGTLSADRVAAAGVAADGAHAAYELFGLGAPDATAELRVTGTALRAGGLAFDSAALHAGYSGATERGQGALQATLFQDSAHDYRLRSRFRHEPGRREITLAELILRFDTVQWLAPRPAHVRWVGDDVVIESLELRGTNGGSIHVHGVAPSEGNTDLRLAIADLPAAHIVALLQDTVQTTGVLNLDATVRGSLASPRIQTTSTLLAASYAGYALPDLRASFDYADTLLEVRAELSRDTHVLALADAELPLNLALSGVTGARTLDRPIRIEARVDSLPLDALTAFTESVNNVRGHLRGGVTVLGTFEEPLPAGAIDLDLAALDIAAAGVALRAVGGTMRFEQDRIVLDSLVARSGRGTIHARGSIGTGTPARPSFDLAVVTRGARVLDNEHGRMRADADLAIAGPLDSLAVTGAVTIVEGVLYAPELDKRRPTELDDPTVAVIADTAAAYAAFLPEPNPVLENLQLDVSVRVARNTWVRNTDANVEIYTPDGAEPLHVRMLPDTGMILDGVLSADRGEYAFSGRIFELTTGSVTFLGGPELDPLLQLTARYEVPRPGREALAILIYITGSMTEPRIALESTAQPPLSQSDLLAYLAFGRPTSSLLSLEGSGMSGGGNGIGALAQQQLAGLAIGALVDEAVADIQREGARAGLDVFRVRPADLPEELAFSGYLANFLRGTEILAGKYLGRRVFVGAQGRPTTEAWPGLRVEYVADRGFSFEAIWEPRFLPAEPSLLTDQEVTTARAFGAFLFWRKRF